MRKFILSAVLFASTIAVAHAESITVANQTAQSVNVLFIATLNGLQDKVPPFTSRTENINDSFGTISFAVFLANGNSCQGMIAAGQKLLINLKGQSLLCQVV